MTLERDWEKPAILADIDKMKFSSFKHAFGYLFPAPQLLCPQLKTSA
jgi:hypothetical protein